MLENVALQLYSVREEVAKSLDNTIAAVAAVGFEKIELWDFIDRSAELKKVLDSYNLTAPSGHADLEQIDPKKLVDVAHSLNLKKVIWPFTSADRWQSEQSIGEIADLLNNFAINLAGEDVQIAYHNHNWEFEQQLNGTSAWQFFLDQLHPEVGIELDTYWAQVGMGDAPKAISDLGDRLIAVHLKDGSLNKDGSGQVPLGQGKMPMKDVIAALPKNILGVVEFDEYADGSVIDAAAQSLDWLKENA